MVSPRAGKPVDPSDLVNVPRLITAYYTTRPDPANPAQRVAFGTSGHRGSSLRRQLQRGAHPGHHPGDLRLPQARRASTARCSSASTRTRCPSRRCAQRARSAGGQRRRGHDRRSDDGYTPTPAISHAILTYNRGRTRGPGRRHRHHAVAQPARGRRLQVQPAQRRPGRHRRHRLDRERRPTRCSATASTGVQRVPLRARAAGRDHASPRLRRRLRRRPRQRASTWTRSAARAEASASIRWAAPACTTGQPIAERYGLDLTVVNDAVDPTFRFMTVDWDGKIRMDCSSPYAMASLIGLKDRFDVAFGNDTDADRHGIVTPQRRAAEPEPLPGGRRSTICSATARTGARTRRSARRWSAAA